MTFLDISNNRARCTNGTGADKGAGASFAIVLQLVSPLAFGFLDLVEFDEDRAVFVMLPVFGFQVAVEELVESD